MLEREEEKQGVAHLVAAACIRQEGELVMVADGYESALGLRDEGQRRSA